MSTVMLPALPETTESPVEEKSIKEGLQRALDLLREDGWTQGTAMDDRGRRCVLGAIWDSKDDDPVYHFQMAVAFLGALGKEPGRPYYWSFRRKDGIELDLLAPDVRYVAHWNDDRERTQAQVETVFEYAIEKAES